MNKEYISEWAKEKAANIILQQTHLSTPLCKHEKICELIDVVIERVGQLEIPVSEPAEKNHALETASVFHKGD